MEGKAFGWKEKKMKREAEILFAIFYFLAVHVSALSSRMSFGKGAQAQCTAPSIPGAK